MSIRNTQYCIKKLKLSGELEVDANKGIRTESGKTNLYIIKIEFIKTRGANLAPVQNPVQGVQNPVQGVQNPVQGVQGVA